MKRLKIDTLEKLETFIKNEAISIEDRLAVFTEALKQYPFYIMEIKYNDTCTTIENRKDVLTGMLRTISEIKADPNQKTYRGFWVSYEIN